MELIELKVEIHGFSFVWFNDTDASSFTSFDMSSIY